MNETYAEETRGIGGAVLTKKPLVSQAIEDQQRIVRQLGEVVRALDDHLMPILEVTPEKPLADREVSDDSPMLADQIRSNTQLVAETVRKLIELNKRIQI